ncbi:MAG: site-specific DNA-methyltransferase [Saprospiraceae bacterium]
MDIKIEYLRPDLLRPSDRNARTHTTAQVSQIAASIREFGFTNPVLADKNNLIIAGHGRVLAALQLDMPAIPVIRLGHLSERQVRALTLADNKIALNSGWDFAKLSEELSELAMLDFDLTLTAFDEQELDVLLKSGSDVLPEFSNDITANAPTNGNTFSSVGVFEDQYDLEDSKIKTSFKYGDLIEIGQHRLLCGDSIDKNSVEKLMNGEKANMVFTDPPYGQNINFSYLGWMTKQKHKNEIIKNDDLDGENLQIFLNAILSNLKIFNKGAYYICSGYKQLPIFQDVFEHNALIVWNKKQLGFGMGDYRNQLEYILYSRNGGGWYGDNSQRNIWEINRENDNKLHPTIKPIELLTIPLQNSSKENDLILDLFLGSGTTMAAAHQLNRKCYGMELDPKYCQVIVDRMLNIDPSLSITVNGKRYERN